MRLQHQKLDRFIAKLFSHVAGGEEIAEALGHLSVVNVDEAVVHPVAGIFLAAAAFALCNFIFVMGEDQIRAAAVNINRFTEMLADHGCAFNMPSRTPVTPGSCLLYTSTQFIPQGANFVISIFGGIFIVRSSC